MKLESRVKAMEKASTGKPCDVWYKAGRGPAPCTTIPVEQALREAAEGRIKSIEFHLTPNEEKAERINQHSRFTALEAAFAAMGRRD